jgi:uncharacterized protein
MRDDEIRAWLRERNPWWRLANPSVDRLAWVRHDVTLRKAADLGLDYRSRVLDDLEPAGLYVVRGPRRVGKSVALKQLAVELLSDPGNHPSQVVYMTLDEFDDRALRRALRLAREVTVAAGDRQRFWLIDEITAVSGWPAVFKSARDDTPLANDTVVLTGSSAHGLTEARRALGPGRVGPAKNPFRVMLPMTFRDFVRVTGRDLPEVPVQGPTLEQDRRLRKVLEDLIPFADEFDLAWQAYLEVGGFPRAVGEHARDGAVSASFQRDLVDWLAPDVTPEDPPESVVRLLAALRQRMTAPMNVRATAEALAMSRERFTTRLNRFLTTFAALSCPQVDERGEPIAGSQSKVYLLDPLLAALPGNGIDMTVMSECVLAMTLARAVERVHPGRLLEGPAIGYGRTSAKTEVDFAPIPLSSGAGTRLMTPPIESKWVSDGWRPGARAIETYYGRGFVATKNVFEVRTPAWAVPAGALAMLLV